MAKPAGDDDDESSGHLREWYSNPTELLQFCQLPLAEIENDCIFVLDANVLLLPYESSSKPFGEITRLFEKLVGQGRLFVPAQAMREFLRHRSKKLGEIAKSLSDFQSQLSIPDLPSIPLLRDDPDYAKAASETKKASDLKTAKNAVGAVIEKLRGPIGTDPVSLVYQKLFADVVLEETEEHFQQAASEIKVRYLQKRPPGYSDAAKPDGGIGDLLIWRALLRLGSDRKHHCVFVSRDRKKDWWIQANGAFQPRLELIEEYRVASGGHTLHLALLGDVLELAGASSDTVDEVRAIEVPNPPLEPSGTTRIFRDSAGNLVYTPPGPDEARRLASLIYSRIMTGKASPRDMGAYSRLLELSRTVDLAQVNGVAREVEWFEMDLASRGISLIRDESTGVLVGLRGPDD